MQGDLVGIRPVTLDDSRLLYDIWHDPDVQRNLNFVDSDPLEKWLKEQSMWKSWLDCIVVSLEDRQSAGYVSLGSIKATPELIILLLPQYRGRGMGTQAVRLIVDYGFSRMGISRVGGGAFHFNNDSQHMLDKVGFVRDPQEDATYDNAWGEGRVTELAYRLDKDIFKR